MDKNLSLAECIDALPLDERDGARVLALIRLAVHKTPERIEEIFPGKRLVKRRLTTTERTQRASAAAAKQSKAAAEERYLRVMPVIERILKDNPSASLADIKAILDDSGITPVRSGKWSRATINYIMTKAGLRAKDQS